MSRAVRQRRRRRSTARGRPAGLPAEPVSRTGYFALLACTATGTLSSTLISAPINVIADDIGASARGIVLAVSAFTIAMVLGSPLSGWMCERFGARTLLIGSLVMMAAAQVGAAASTDLWTLTVMRSLQGLACSALPPAVQQILTHFWRRRQGRVLAAWASATGVGQALGPPLGGFITDLTGWRAVFLTHGLICLTLGALLIWQVPRVPSGRPPLHISGTLSLIVGVGSAIIAFTWVGQAGLTPAAGVLGATGLLALVVYLWLSIRSPRAMVPPRLLIERRYLRSTVAAATVMGVLGVMITAIPLHLGRDLAMNPGAIGAIMLCFAGGMACFAPLSSRLAEWASPRIILQAGAATMALALIAMAVITRLGDDPAVLTALIATLLMTGCALGAVQANAALGLMRSAAARYGAALGLHNMMRFTGMALGYAWVATTYPLGDMAIVFAGPIVVAILTLILLLGPAAPPIEDRTTGDAPEESGRSDS